MVYINTSRTVRVEWTIMRDRHVKEDMSRAEKVKYILHTPSGRMTVNADVDNPVVLTMPNPLEEGEYGVECIWTKNRQREIIKGGGKTICKAKADAVFVVTSDATKAPATTATAVVKVRSYVGIYGYDGLDAWELAVMNGKTDKNEREWTSLFANLQAALDEGTYPSTGDYAVDAVFTPENTNHLATTGAIYDALKASVGLNDMAALGEDMGYGEVNPKDVMLTLPLPRTAAVVNITMQVDNDELHKPGKWGSKAGKVEYFDRDGNYFVRNATISRQGETSVGMAQSNMKIEIGTNDLGQESPIKFGDWVPQESFHLKAYYIDVFRGVSIVGYRLAEQAIQQLGCRPNRFKNEANNTTEYNGEGGDLETYNDKDLGTDALCHPDGFPVEVFINKEYYGLMVWALRKQRANYQMDENNQEEVLLEGNLGYNTTNGESPSGFFQPNDGLIDWSVVEFKNPKNSLVQDAKVLAKKVASASWKAYFGEYDSSTGKYEREEKINSSDEATAAEGIAEAKAAWEAVYDKDAVLLYYLLSQVVYNYDGFSKNWVWSIYNTGTTANPEIHAAPNVYDLDSVFGRSVQGSFVIERSTTHLLNRANPRRTGGAINYAFALPTCFAWYMYKNELNEMYAKLRNSGVFSTANIVNLLKGWIASVGRDAYARNMRGDTNKWGIDSDNPIPSYRGTNLNTSYWKIKNDGSPTWVNAVWEDNGWVWNIPESITPWNSATDYAVGDECWDYSKVYTTEINTTPRRLYWKVECVQACTNKEPLDNAMADYMPYDLGMFDSVPRIEKWLDARLEKLDDEYKYVAPVLTSLTDVISVLGNPDGALVKKGEIIVEQGALSQGTDQWKVSIPKGTEFTIKVEDPDHVLDDNETFYIRMLKGTNTNVGGVRGAVAGQEYSLIAPEDLIGIGLSSNGQEIVLADGSLTLTYKKPDDGLFGRVEDLEYATKGESNETKGNLAKGSDVNFLMFSDVHQDTLAVQHIMQQATAWGNDIDFVLNGGDTVSNVNNSGLDWYNGTGGLVENAGKPVLDVIGNHDAWHINEETEIRGWDTDENITSLVIQPMVERGWVSSTNKPYYVKDFPADNPQVRFIVLCAMAEKQDGQPETSHYWDSNQADFLIRILNDARRDGLPVIIVNHCSFDAAKATGVNCPFTSWIGSAKTSHEDTLHLPYDAVRLVDNFIRDGGQFVCWLTGHRHRDVVSYIDEGNGKQFCFSTAAANHDTSRNYDSYRSGNTQDKSYDCYNLIGVDIAHGWLKIMRIGLNTDQALREKEEMVLDYVNGKIVNDSVVAKADKDDVPNDVVRTAEDATFVYSEGGTIKDLFYLRKVDSQLAGLMTAADKQKLDGMPAGTYIPVSGQMNANGFTFVDVHGTPLFTIPFADSTGGGLITFNDLSRFIELGTKQELDAQFATKANKAVVDAIQALIPSQATASNQLADKDFVNSSIATSTATFRGSFNLVADLSLSVGATHAQIAAALGTHIATADNNDYAFVFIPTSDDTPTEIAAIERYKFNGTTWAFEYALNNSGFTAVQWAAINSGITALLVAKLQALPTASEIEDALRNKADKDEVEEKLAEKANTADLESGAVVPALAGNLQSWDERGTLPKENEWDEAIRTSGGSMSIVSGQGADFLELKGGLGMSKVTAIRTTGFNKLHSATEIGNGYYFLVPRMVFGTYGTANENNGMLFTNSDHENLKPTVRFKALSAGVPTSVNDGSVCTYTDYNDTTKDKTYRFYTCPEIGYMIVSGITYADTCAHVGWSGRYDEFKSPTDADDAGTTLLMTAAINTMHSHGYMVGVERQGLLVSDNIVQTSKTQARWTSLCDIVKPTWTTIENEDGTYTHTATISAMLSGGGAYIEGINIEVEGNTVSYTSNSDTPTTEYVCYEKTTATTGTVNLAQHLTIEDWGFEELVGMEGSVSVVMQYYMGYPDTLAAIAQIELKKVVETVDNLVEEVETEIAYNDTLGNVKALSLDSERLPMVSGRPLILFAEGTPAEANVPLNWDNDTMGNWNGIPCFEGQLYVNISASSGGLYYAVNTTAVGGWKQT